MKSFIAILFLSVLPILVGWHHIDKQRQEIIQLELDKATLAKALVELKQSVIDLDYQVDVLSETVNSKE